MQKSETLIKKKQSFTVVVSFSFSEDWYLILSFKSSELSKSYDSKLIKQIYEKQ